MINYELTEEQKAMFNSLGQAFMSHRAYIVKSKRRSDGEEVVLICILNPDGMGEDEDMIMGVLPVAVLIEDNPFELYEDPTGDENEWSSNGKE